MPTLQQLKYLIAVDHHRNFSKAAQACNVSQPSLSQQVREAEEELGVVIFDRDKRRVLTTERGQALLDQAKIILRESERLAHLSQQEKGEVRGSFHLAVIPTLASYLIPMFLRSFAEAYPKVMLKISEMKTEEIIENLREDRLDGGLLATPLREAGISEQILFYEPMFVFVHPDHPLFAKAKVRESDLSNGEIWLLSEGHCFRNQTLNICSLRGKHKVFKNIDFESGDFETLIQLVKNNGGYTLLPHLAAESLRSSEGYRWLRPFVKPMPVREISLVSARRALKAEIQSALTGSIQKALPPELHTEASKGFDIVDI